MWLNEYERLMFGIDNDEEKTVRGIEMKNNNMPNILYKYRCVNENNLNAFLNDEIYLSSVSEFNDIQESKLNIEYEQVRNHVYSVLKQPMKEKLGIDFVLTPEDCVSKETIHRKILAAISFIPKEDYDYWMACYNAPKG